MLRFVEGRCAFCGSLPRHRLLAYTLAAVPRSVGNPTVLHVGANPIERRWVDAHVRPAAYHRIDILPTSEATIVADAASLPLPDSSADIAVAWHVLEHIPRDRQAIIEIFRVLRPGGLFFASVPIHPKRRRATFEDPTTPPSERERVYGFHEHVRACGLDYGDRFAAAGFEPRTVAIDDQPGEAVERYGLSRGHVAWICRRP